MIQRGDIWLVDFSYFNADAVPASPAFTRPAIVVSNDGINQGKLRTVIVVSGTIHERRLPQHLALNPAESGLKRRTLFQPELVTTVIKHSLLQKVGYVPPTLLLTLDHLPADALDMATL